ncbi:MAG: hypothetical protein EPO57_04120 [Chitinophagaceae bacterium]|nr:MAG: hypothetical protein EPO57_04120 [Chitinophagaceae bacterium]
MKKLKELLSLNRVSIFLLVLPYLIFNYATIVHSPFFSFPLLMLFLILLFAIDFLLKWIATSLRNKKLNIFSLSLVFIGILFFYGTYITGFLQTLINENFTVLVRGRTILEFLVIICILLIIILREKTITYQYFNIFLIFFCIIILASSLKNNKSRKVEKFQNNYIHISKKDSSTKPVLLIISDEYTSPDGLYNIYKDSSIYEFSKQLAKSGWITENSFYSYELSTIHSISSLFNFNLSINNNYSKQRIADLGSSKLMHAAIADSFKQKAVKIINFGIFHIGETSYLSHLYRYPTSFWEEILTNTIFFKIQDNTGDLNKSGFANSFFPTEVHNKYIFKHLQDTSNKIKQTNTFIYTHLFMPHSPMQFTPGFPLRFQNNLTNYFAYWNFTNSKLTQLLTGLAKENRYRIILTGDHGFRNDNRINPHYTFTALYGFDQGSIEKIKSVQDLGSLINGYFDIKKN